MLKLAEITGNASDEIKKKLDPVKVFSGIRVGKPVFGDKITERLQVTEVSVVPMKEEPSRSEGRVVCHLVVTEDMLNGGGNMHGGCAAFLLDVCTTLSMLAFFLGTTGHGSWTVSQSINISYHAPAGLGDVLKIVCITVANGARAQTARIEIWNETHHRLVASGTHTKMAPSERPKL